MKCGICSRGRKEILEDCIVESKVTETTEVEVFYITGTNQLICPRCASEKLLPLGYGGNAYLTYHAHSKKFSKMQGIKLDNSQIILEDDTNSNREAAQIEGRDRIEKMMAQI